MSTTVLIPTDFSMDSIESLRSLLLFQKEQKMRVLLIHGVHLGNSITELLFFDQKELKYEMAGRRFLNALENLEEELHNYVDDIQILFFTGATQSNFNHFVEANGIDRIIIPSEGAFDWSDRRSINIVPYLQKANVRKQVITWKKDPVTNAISSLFISSSIS